MRGNLASACLARPTARLAGVLWAAAALALPAFGEEPVLSGTLESGLYAAALDPSLSQGESSSAWRFSQGANLRFRAAAGEKGTVNGSFNLLAWSADAPEPTVNLAAYGGADPDALRTNLSVSAEVERLYLTLRGESADLDAGLMRMAFGYAPAFRPTDVINPPNPLFPDARPRGVLGAALTAYPAATAKLRAFAASRSGEEGESSPRPLLGLSGDLNASRLSVQPVYFLRLPETFGRRGDQYAGLSLKAEAGAAFTLEALWTDERRDAGFGESVSCALSADWSAFDAKLYLLAQYLWNGPGAEGINGTAALGGRQYLFSTASWQWDDYTNIGLSALGNLEDGSMAPALTLTHEPFQGMKVTLTGRVFLDMGDGEGEFSSSGAGSGYTRGSLEARAALRF